MEKETEKVLEKIRSVRQEKKIPILKLAADAEISHSHLYYIETKKVVPSLDLFIKLARNLGMNAKDFFD